MARYALQSVARSWLWDPVEGLQGSWHRLAGCHRWLGARTHGGERREARYVELLHDPERMRAYYRGLQTCGSSWADPLCSGVIYDYRRAEVAEVLRVARERGWAVLFITLTAAHKRDTELAPFMDKLAEAMRRVYQGRVFQDFKSSVGYRGAVKGVEVTYGANGWHPHFHLLWLTERATAAQVQAYVDGAWAAALRAVGLAGLRGVRAVVKDSSMTADAYVAKFDRIREWDLDAELTLWSRKRGSKGPSPWDLLRAGLEDDPVAAERARRLFVEYAAATKGRHSLQFSPGLRELVGLAARGDEEIAAGETDAAELAALARLDRLQWRMLLANDCRGELLQVASAGDPVRVARFLTELGIYPMGV